MDDAFAALKLCHRPAREYPREKKSARRVVLQIKVSPWPPDDCFGARVRRSLAAADTSPSAAHAPQASPLIALWINKTTVLCHQ